MHVTNPIAILRGLANHCQISCNLVPSRENRADNLIRAHQVVGCDSSLNRIANLPPSRAILTWVGKNRERKK